MLAPENKQKAKMPSTLSTLIHHGTETPKQYKKARKDMQIRKEEIKLSIYADSMIIYL